MSQSFLITPMRVAVQNRHRKPTGYHFRVGTRAGGRDDRNTLCGPGLPPIESLPAIPSAVSHALTPLGGGNLAGRLSEADPLVSLVCRSFLGVVNFCRLQAYTAGKCFSLSALVHDANQSASVLRVLFTPFHSAEPFGIPSILIPSLTGTRYQAGRPVHGGICKRERHAKCAKNLSLRCKEL